MSSSRILIGATGSGAGKTTVTCALLQALVNRGLQVQSFKCGPDYIDPMFHESVIGAKSGNLDLFLLPQPVVCWLLAKGQARRDFALIEGVMGYYDGVGGFSSRAGAYDLARATRTPSVLVVGARGMSLSLLAVIEGFLHFEKDSGIRGVIFNQLSPMLYPRLKELVEGRLGIQALGYLPPMPDCSLESRHLGLVTAGEVAGLRQKLQRLAAQAEKTLEIDRILQLGQAAPPLAGQAPAVPPAACPVRLAVAQDAAFCFYYGDGLALLEEAGAQLLPFSPLAGDPLPEEADGLLLGGGYPELYAGALAENREFWAQVARRAAGGMPLVAECGGFMALHEQLEGEDGRLYPMAGLIPGRCYRTPRLQRFGYVTLTARQDSLLCRAGEQLPAHEFHYWDSQSPGDAFTAKKAGRPAAYPCGHAGRRLYAGFPHFHWCTNPALAARLVAQCGQYQKERG